MSYCIMFPLASYGLLSSFFLDEALAQARKLLHGDPSRQQQEREAQQRLRIERAAAALPLLEDDDDSVLTEIRDYATCAADCAVHTVRQQTGSLAHNNSVNHSNVSSDSTVTDNIRHQERHSNINRTGISSKVVVSAAVSSPATAFPVSADAPLAASVVNADGAFEDDMLTLPQEDIQQQLLPYEKNKEKVVDSEGLVHLRRATNRLHRNQASGSSRCYRCGTYIGLGNGNLFGIRSSGNSIAYVDSSSGLLAGPGSRARKVLVCDSCRKNTRIVEGRERGRRMPHRRFFVGDRSRNGLNGEISDKETKTCYQEQRLLDRKKNYKEDYQQQRLLDVIKDVWHQPLCAAAANQIVFSAPLQRGRTYAEVRVRESGVAVEDDEPEREGRRVAESRQQLTSGRVGKPTWRGVAAQREMAGTVEVTTERGTFHDIAAREGTQAATTRNYVGGLSHPVRSRWEDTQRLDGELPFTTTASLPVVEIKMTGGVPQMEVLASSCCTSSGSQRLKYESDGVAGVLQNLFFYALPIEDVVSTLTSTRRAALLTRLRGLEIPAYVMENSFFFEGMTSHLFSLAADDRPPLQQLVITDYRNTDLQLQLDDEAAARLRQAVADQERQVQQQQLFQRYSQQHGAHSEARGDDDEEEKQEEEEETEVVKKEVLEGGEEEIENKEEGLKVKEEVQKGVHMQEKEKQEEGKHEEMKKEEEKKKEQQKKEEEEKEGIRSREEEDKTNEEKKDIDTINADYQHGEFQPQGVVGVATTVERRRPRDSSAARNLSGAAKRTYSEAEAGAAVGEVCGFGVVDSLAYFVGYSSRLEELEDIFNGSRNTAATGAGTRGSPSSSSSGTNGEVNSLPEGPSYGTHIAADSEDSLCLGGGNTRNHMAAPTAAITTTLAKKPSSWSEMRDSMVVEEALVSAALYNECNCYTGNSAIEYFMASETGSTDIGHDSDIGINCRFFCTNRGEEGNKELHVEEDSSQELDEEYRDTSVSSSRRRRRTRDENSGGTPNIGLFVNGVNSHSSSRMRNSGTTRTRYNGRTISNSSIGRRRENWQENTYECRSHVEDTLFTSSGSKCTYTSNGSDRWCQPQSSTRAVEASSNTSTRYFEKRTGETGEYKVRHGTSVDRGTLQRRHVAEENEIRRGADRPPYDGLYETPYASVNHTAFSQELSVVPHSVQQHIRQLVEEFPHLRELQLRFSIRMPRYFSTSEAALHFAAPFAVFAEDLGFELQQLLLQPLHAHCRQCCETSEIPAQPGGCDYSASNDEQMRLPLRLQQQKTLVCQEQQQLHMQTYDTGGHEQHRLLRQSQRLQESHPVATETAEHTKKENERSSPQMEEAQQKNIKENQQHRGAMLQQQPQWQQSRRVSDRGPTAEPRKGRERSPRLVVKHGDTVTTAWARAGPETEICRQEHENRKQRSHKEGEMEKQLMTQQRYNDTALDMEAVSMGERQYLHQLSDGRRRYTSRGRSNSRTNEKREYSKGSPSNRSSRDNSNHYTSVSSRLHPWQNGSSVSSSVRGSELRFPADTTVGDWSYASQTAAEPVTEDEENRRETTEPKNGATPAVKSLCLCCDEEEIGEELSERLRKKYQTILRLKAQTAAALAAEDRRERLMGGASAQPGVVGAVGSSEHYSRRTSGEWKVAVSTAGMATATEETNSAVSPFKVWKTEQQRRLEPAPHQQQRKGEEDTFSATHKTGESIMEYQQRREQHAFIGRQHGSRIVRGEQEHQGRGNESEPEPGMQVKREVLHVEQQLEVNRGGVHIKQQLVREQQADAFHHSKDAVDVVDREMQRKGILTYCTHEIKQHNGEKGLLQEEKGTVLAADKEERREERSQRQLSMVEKWGRQQGEEAAEKQGLNSIERVGNYRAQHYIDAEDCTAVKASMLDACGGLTCTSLEQHAVGCRSCCMFKQGYEQHSSRRGMCLIHSDVRNCSGNPGFFFHHTSGGSSNTIESRFQGNRERGWLQGQHYERTGSSACNTTCTCVLDNSNGCNCCREDTVVNKLLKPDAREDKLTRLSHAGDRTSNIHSNTAKRQDDGPPIVGFLLRNVVLAKPPPQPA